MISSLLFSYGISAISYKAVNASCNIADGNPTFAEGIDPNAAAWAYWEDSLNETGWYKLHIKGNSKYTDSEIMKCAGYLEGYVSHDRINNHFNLIFDIQEWTRNRKYPDKIYQYLSSNLRYVRQSIEAYSATSKFWQEIAFIMNQFDGLVAGYQAIDGDATMNELDLWFLQSEGDMFDISEMYPDVKQPKEKTYPGEHCTGLVRLLPDYSDIFFSHDSWSDFRELHGELKEYDLPIKAFKAKKISLSTRIGKLSSYDDFYINDQGLFVLETTMTNFNDELYEQSKPQSLFTWMRAVHATWCSDSGKEWTDNFGQHNSGTYNNQYLIVDSKKFKRGEKPTTDLLWIIEQMPGTFEKADITGDLLRDGYFPSINTPYFDRLFELAGYPAKIASWGDDGNYWDYKTSSRYIIMAREAPFIKDFEQFKSFMRYSNWKRDPYAHGDAGQMIIARYDLRDLPNPHFVKRMFGGLDTKALRLTEATTSMMFHALASPECLHNPVFNFNDWDVKHDGLPDKWNHTWQVFQSIDGDKCMVHGSNKTSCFQQEGCGFCMSSQMCYSGYKDSPYVMECDAGWEVPQPPQPWAKPTIIAVTVIVVIFVLSVYAIHFMNNKKN
ncbi:Laminin A family protein [Trichomonas vaginalis G3]|uniref:Phospholipase B-like n=1 Tax=Trichomonas vaginalis (strain ATCC PRA-98 / G3) TaxID=412133 RepID=A2DVP3_TRIV3|nr:phosphatidylinositol catabolic process [Trichomonas vaginalis G3]EAY15585.1 Laminin A family protein [Trichomonas vaginalis G3]KAI5526231.1 phosphatidylinositol catabolic process [Trichomonas vaginalis G3]|eukprot:XP_001327808.1 Laminin A family protein [Trichomonas vaginalis G3]